MRSAREARSPRKRGRLLRDRLLQQGHGPVGEDIYRYDGLAGENIHIYARITGLADVFDALSHQRVYKDAWKIEDVFDYVRNEKGTLLCLDVRGGK